MKNGAAYTAPFSFFRVPNRVPYAKTAFSKSLRMPIKSGADEGNRTLYIQLGKLTFYR